MSNIYATWCISNNFGDVLTPWLIKALTGKTPVYVEPTEYCEKYMFAGSILNWADKNTIVWGAGLANRNDVVNVECQILAIRGSISKKRANVCGNINIPEIYGDPALILPVILDSKISVKYEVGIIPHYVDQFPLQYASFTKDPRVKVINVFDEVETVISEVLQCRRILSSSLHGLIVADAYGIPSKWFEASNKLGGDGTKFKDHFLTVGIQPYRPAKLYEIYDRTVEQLIELIGNYKVRFDNTLLWNACPLR